MNKSRALAAFFCLLIFLGLGAAAYGQAPASAPAIDRVLAVVDNEIILQSEVDNQYRYMLQNGKKDDGTLRCQVLEELLANKLMLVKARLDSLEVSDDRVEQEVQRRIDYMAQQMGSQEELEKVYRKTIPEIKVDLRDQIRDQLLIQAQRDAILDKITATPREVREFFERIPKDSLPYFPAEVEISHIVIEAKANEKSKAETRQKLEGIRAQIMSGEMTFEQMARYYGEDGTRNRDGYLGEFGRGIMDPAFEEVVYTLEEGQVSPVFETQFGFHIAKLLKRVGDKVQASHILLMPQLTPDAEEEAKKRLREIRTLITTDSMSFPRAASQFSQDRDSKDNGGILTSASGDFRIPLDQLEADLYFKVDGMKPGEVSEPMAMTQEPGNPRKSFHIIMLRKRHSPHRANLEQDFLKFQNATIQAKNAAEMDRWFQRARQQVYIEIKENECSQALTDWRQ